MFCLEVFLIFFVKCGDCKMKDKYYDFTSTLIMGISFIIISIFLLIGKNQLYRDVVHIVVFIIWGKAFMDMIRLFFRKEVTKKRKKVLFSCLFHLIICFIFAILPDVILGIVPFLFASYLMILGIIQWIMCWLEIKHGNVLSFFLILIGMIYFGIAIPILLAPVSRLDTFLVCLAIYVLFLGISFV